MLRLFVFLIASADLSAGRRSSKTAEIIKYRYNNLNITCLDQKGIVRPAFWCSGIMIRGVDEGQRFHAWGISPRSKKLNAFSVAYLRRDAQFSKLMDYTSGFIITPHTKRGYFKPVVYCAFPFDAYTHKRPQRGCGRSYKAVLGESRQCHLQGVNTFSSWQHHFQRVRKNVSHEQCGFDLTGPSAPDLFRAFLSATEFLKDTREYAYVFNEMMVGAWDENRPEMLPIEAFFFLKGSRTGLLSALKYQTDFKRAGGGCRPVISIKLPGLGKEFDAFGYD